MVSGKSFPTWIGQAKERLSGEGKNNRAPRVAGSDMYVLEDWLFWI